MATSRWLRVFFAASGLLVLAALGVEKSLAAPPVQKPSSREYDPQNVVTVAGLITALAASASSTLPEPVFVTLTTPQGKVKVFLGPNWYVAEQGLNLALFDRLEVTGAKIMDQGRMVILAAQVKKGDQTWQIRDETGKPLWTGRKQEGK